jgi:integrase
VKAQPTSVASSPRFPLPRQPLRLDHLIGRHLGAARCGGQIKFFDLRARNALWVVPASRMKMKKGPLSEQAVAILRAQEAERGKNPFVFAGRPQRPLSGMAMSVLLRRMKVDATVHGMRSSARS